MNINWYPGHMKKTKEMIVDNFKIVDIIVEVVDARIPISSKNPDIIELSKNKKKITVLNKSDLVDKKELVEWGKKLKEKKYADEVIWLSSETGDNFKEFRILIDKLHSVKLEKMKKKGLRTANTRLMIVGIPNVGKSAFINRVVKKNKAGVGNKPGFTRGKQWIKLSSEIELLDTPGILWPKIDDERVAFNLAITGSIRDDILPIEEVAFQFLRILKEKNMLQIINKFYNIEEDLQNLEMFEILDIIGKRLGAKKNSEYDYNGISRLLLRDYRSSKLGKFVLEIL